VSSSLDFIFLGNFVAVTDLLIAVQAEIRLLVEAGRPVRVRWDGAVFGGKTLRMGFCEAEGSGGEGAEEGEAWW